MKETISILVKLCQVDNDIHLLKTQREEIPAKVSQQKLLLENLKSKIKSSELTVEDQRKKILDVATRVREKNEWIAERENKTREIKTNKEYQASLKEISLAKKEILDTEALLPGLEAALGDAQNVLLQAMEAFENASAEIEKQINDLTAELNALHPQLEKLISERNRVEPSVPAKALQLYNHVRQRVIPTLAKAEKFCCLECGSRMQPQLFNQLFTSEELICCPRCKRILYLEQHLQQ